MARPRLTGHQRIAQDAATAALQTAHEHRKDNRRYYACLDYAARTIDRAREGIQTVDRDDRARRD